MLYAKKKRSKRSCWECSGTNGIPGGLGCHGSSSSDLTMGNRPFSSHASIGYIIRRSRLDRFVEFNPANRPKRRARVGAQKRLAKEQREGRLPLGKGCDQEKDSYHIEEERLEFLRPSAHVPRSQARLTCGKGFDMAAVGRLRAR